MYNKDSKNTTPMRPPIGRDGQLISEDEMQREAMEKSTPPPKPQRKGGDTGIKGGEMYEEDESAPETRNNDTTSKSPNNKPSQAEGSEETVEEDLKQKGLDE